MTKAIAIVLVTLFVKATLPLSASQEPQIVGKSYYLNRNLIYLNYLPKVFPDNIVFAESCDDKWSGNAQILNKKALVKIAALSPNGNFLKASFVVPRETFIEQRDSFDLLLSNRSRKDFEKSFSLIFSEKEPDATPAESCSSNQETKAQVIACQGFPIFYCKQGDTERLFYTLEYAGQWNSFDTWWIEFKKGKVINITGTI